MSTTNQSERPEKCLHLASSLVDAQSDGREGKDSKPPSDVDKIEVPMLDLYMHDAISVLVRRDVRELASSSSALLHVKI